MDNTTKASVVSDWLVEALPYEVMWMNKQGEIVYANSMFCERLGYRKAEIIGLSIFDINRFSTKESWEKHWKQVKKEKEHSFKATHINKSGKYYDVEVFANFFSNNGKEMICAVVNEITESSFYKNILENTERIAHVGGWKMNLQDGSLIVTAETLEIFGATETEHLRPINIQNYFKDPETFKNLLIGAMRKGESFDKVFGLLSNPVKYVRAVGQPVVKGKNIIKVIIVFQDVTIQRAREKHLQLYKEVINNAEDLIYLYNREGKLVHYGDSVVDKLGFSHKQLDGFSIYDLDAGVTPEWWESHFDEIIEKGCLHFEWLITRKNGTKFVAEITANHIRFEDQDFNCAIVRDITERKKRDEELIKALQEIKLLKERLEVEVDYLQEEISSAINFENIICQSEAYKKVLDLVNQVAPTDTTVLITGESGTGKELLARALHNNSYRKDRPLIKINCATLPKDLIESELFGHKRGAFTGAVEDKLGKFALADQGTIFLDEIGELSVEVQSKLLRVLQEGEFDEVGGSKTVKVDVRVIAATNRNLEEMIKERKFREDLFYRLNVFPIFNIPLRARKEDIPLLAQYFLEKYSKKTGKSFKRLSKKTIEKLMVYSFPGNIRELENIIERAVIIESGNTLNPGDWLPNPEGVIMSDEFKPFEEMQRDYIVKVLEHTGWRVSGPKGAAAILNMNGKTLFAKMKRLGIEKQVSLKK